MNNGFRPARRMDAIGLSEILKILKRAGEFRRQGHDLIDLSAGEPDFDTPEPVKEAAIRAMREGWTKYTQLDGRPELKAAIQRKLRDENGLRYELDEIMVSAGAKQVFSNAMMASLDNGDEVILAAPYWTSYAGMVKIAGGRPVEIQCPAEAGFLLSPGQLEAAISKRTRWLVLNSPSNPAGALHSRSSLQALADVLHRHPKVWLLSDDIYEHIVYDGAEFVCAPMLDEGLKRRTLIVNGLSKAYAMTGWRLGYGAGPKDLIKSMLSVQSQTTSCACSISQAAAMAALNGPLTLVRERCELFQARRDQVVAGLNGIDGLSCRAPSGAFYAYISCARLIGAETRAGERLSTDADIAEFLFRQAGVALVPGAAFGLSPFLRLSFAASKAQLEAAVGCIKAACASLNLAPGEA